MLPSRLPSSGGVGWSSRGGRSLLRRAQGLLRYQSLGDVDLGGSDFDARLAQHFTGVLRRHWSDMPFSISDAVVRSAEQVRIHLSNNRKANLALPLSEEAWLNMTDTTMVILPMDGKKPDDTIANQTHVLCTVTRQDFERLCRSEFQALLRPIREVAIMSGALLAGDASPSSVEAILELEEDASEPSSEEVYFDDFYGEDENAPTEPDPDLLLALRDLDLKERKKSQQRRRRKARQLAKVERKFRQEKRSLERSDSSSRESGRVKVRDGISGRPISQVVLVGGATRMPAIGRLLA